MAGKTKKPAAKKENRGGKRVGSGRKGLLAKWSGKPEDMIKIAHEIAVEKKKTIDEVIIDFIYDTEAKISERLAAAKLVKEYTIAKVHKSEVEVTKKQAPKIYLPEKKPDPAKVIPIGGKKKCLWLNNVFRYS